VSFWGIAAPLASAIASGVPNPTDSRGAGLPVQKPVFFEFFGNFA
jgi:hypothetical protein